MRLVACVAIWRLLFFGSVRSFVCSDNEGKELSSCYDYKLRNDNPLGKSFPLCVFSVVISQSVIIRLTCLKHLNHIISIVPHPAVPRSNPIITDNNSRKIEGSIFGIRKRRRRCGSIGSWSVNLWKHLGGEKSTNKTWITLNNNKKCQIYFFFLQQLGGIFRTFHKIKV